MVMTTGQYSKDDKVRVFRVVRNPKNQIHDVIKCDVTSLVFFFLNSGLLSRLQPRDIRGHKYRRGRVLRTSETRGDYVRWIVMGWISKRVREGVYMDEVRQKSRQKKKMGRSQAVG